jgi:hypothetical protein
MLDVTFGFIIGVLVAGLLVALHVICTYMTESYFNVGRQAEPLRELDPEAYAIMYRAKQHAVNVAREPMSSGSSIRQRAMRMYVSFQPDTRYLRLERNVTKLAMGTVPAHKHVGVIKRCRKDICFLDDPVEVPRHMNFIVHMIVGILRTVLEPRRTGPTEPLTTTARAAVKYALELRIASYEVQSENLSSVPKHGDQERYEHGL